jgi:hypothetical protein
MPELFEVFFFEYLRSFVLQKAGTGLLPDFKVQALITYRLFVEELGNVFEGRVAGFFGLFLFFE